ncbi:MAG: hypothetical protein GY750_21105 [Lentisphaerae bacterium]|nr:hypothetical protein [Lentisphaerota bacterium]MCP4103892.1 hypothetical protein [Lentisphaerota bacterium]
MNNNSFFSIKSLAAGTLQIEFYSDINSETALMTLPAENCDPLAEMADTLIKIHSSYDPDGNVMDNTVRFFTFWEADKAMYSCEYTPKPNRLLEVEMTVCNNMYAGIHTHDDLCLKFARPLCIILKNTYEEMKNLLVNQGFCGYRSNWSTGEFPVSYFIQLHSLVNDESISQCQLGAELKALSKINIKQ